jgi:hypothetical protein
MQSEGGRQSSWFRFRLGDIIVYTFLVAALFALGRLADSKINDFPDAPAVSLAFATKQITDGKVVAMKMRTIGDEVVGYAELSQATSMNDSNESSSNTLVFAMRRSDGSANRMLRLLQKQNVPWQLSSENHAFTLTLPLAGVVGLTLAAIVFLRVRNRRPRNRRPSAVA